MDNLVKQVESASREGFSGWKLLELAGMGVCLANPLAGLTLMVGSAVASAMEHNQKLSETRMPDEWLKEISDSENVSKKGLAHLASCLEKKGYVSAKDALRWVEMERQYVAEQQVVVKKVSSMNSSGARALLNRASRECEGLFSVNALKSALDMLPNAKTLASAVTDAGAAVGKVTSFLKSKS